MSSILVIFEWEPINDPIDDPSSRPSDDDTSTTLTLGIRRTKIRLEKDAAIQSLLNEISSKVLRQDAFERYQVEIFETDRSAYFPLDSCPAHYDVDQATLRQRFGQKVWRVRAIQRRNPSESTLALPGRAFAVDTNDSQGFPVGSGVRLKINERHNQRDSTAFTVWDGGVLLARYLEKRPEMIRGKNVLELGSGCGLVGLTAAVLGARHVCLTDLPDAVPLLVENAQANRALWDAAGSSVTCSALDWFQPLPVVVPPRTDAPAQGGCWDVILVADCVWTMELVAPLLETLLSLINQQQQQQQHGRSNGTGPELLISYQRRGLPAHEAFWSGLAKHFQVQELDVNRVGIPLPNPKLTLSLCTPKS